MTSILNLGGKRADIWVLADRGHSQVIGVANERRSRIDHSLPYRVSSARDALTCARVNHYHEEPVWAYAAGLDSLRMREVHTMAFETATIASGGPVWRMACGVLGRPWA